MDAIEIIRQKRKEKKYTQADIANVLGIRQTTYSDIENKRIQLKADDFIKICCFLGISLDSFINDDFNAVILSRDEINAIISISRKLSQK